MHIFFASNKVSNARTTFSGMGWIFGGWGDTSGYTGTKSSTELCSIYSSYY